MAQAEIEARRRHKAHGKSPDPLCPCNWPGEPGERKARPSDGLVETIQQAMPTTADMRAEYAPDDAQIACPHCPCTYSDRVLLLRRHQDTAGGFVKYDWDPAVWREPTYMIERRSYGVRVWFTGAEIQFGKQMIRFRWLSR